METKSQGAKDEATVEGASAPPASDGQLEFRVELFRQVRKFESNNRNIHLSENNHRARPQYAVNFRGGRPSVNIVPRMAKK